jgi:hypothetical protein
VPAVSYALCVRACVVGRNGKSPRLSVSNKRDTIFSGASLLVKKFYSQSHPSHTYYTSVKRVYFRLNQDVAGRCKTPGRGGGGVELHTLQHVTLRRQVPRHEALEALERVEA